MAREYFDDQEPAQKPKREYLDQPKAPSQELSAVDQIAEITRRGARETGYTAPEGAQPAPPVSLTQSVLQSMYGIPLMAGGARLAQALTKGMPKVAPYTQRFAELMIPRTGKELARTTAAVGTGTAAAYGAGELLPAGTSPFVREPVQFIAGALGELPYAAGQQLTRATRPYFERGVESAAERVTRAFKPERIESLPEFRTGKTEIRRDIQERLRQAPLTTPETAAQDVSQILGTEAVARRGRAEELGRRLAGRVEARAGRIGQPASATTIGTEARDALDSRLTELKQTRSTNAKANEEAAFGAAVAKERQGLRVNQTEASKQGVAMIDDMLKNPETKLPNVTLPEVRSQLQRVKGLISGRMQNEMGEIVEAPVSFQSLEVLRRFLRDRSSGLPAEGFDAIGQQQAGRLADIVETIQKDFSPGFATFLEQYKRDSEPINQFRKALGKAITGREEFDFNEFRTDPARLANQIFATPKSVQDFITLSGNNVNLVKNLARRYLASAIEGKNAAGITKELAKNDWLNLPVFADVKRDFAEQARLAGKAVTRGQARAEQARAGTEAMILETPTRTASQGFRGLLTGPYNEQNVRQATAVLMKQPGGVETFKQAVRDTMAAEPPGSLLRVYSQRIRPALQASGLYRPEEINELGRIVDDLDKVNLAVTRAMSRVESMPGTLSPERELTQLIQDEVYQVRVGTTFGGALAGLIAGALTNFGLGYGAVGGVAGTAALTRTPFLRDYREYNANIRKAVSDIISDPVRLRQVLAAPREQQPGILAGMLRAGLYSAATATNAPSEE